MICFIALLSHYSTLPPLCSPTPLLLPLLSCSFTPTTPLMQIYYPANLLSHKFAFPLLYSPTTLLFCCSTLPLFFYPTAERL